MVFVISAFGGVSSWGVFKEMPQKVIDSFLSAEDKNFFNHPGVDAKGVTRAVLKSLFSSKK